MDIFIDIGNTNASFWFVNRIFSVSTNEFARNNCQDFLQKYMPRRVFIASVVPNVSNDLENSCKKMGIFCKNIVFDDLNLQTTLTNNAELGNNIAKTLYPTYPSLLSDSHLKIRFNK